MLCPGLLLVSALFSVGFAMTEHWCHIVDFIHCLLHCFFVVLQVLLFHPDMEGLNTFPHPTKQIPAFPLHLSALCGALIS